MKIQTIDEKFLKFTEYNNTIPEINEHISSNGYKSYSLIIKDFLKYPDEFSNLIASFPHFKNDKNDTGRPGSSCLFSEGYYPKMTFFIRKCLFEIFKVNFECNSLYTNCFSGIMNTHKIPPHCDINNPYSIYQGPHLVANLGLSKNLKGGTSFWTFLKRSGFMEMTYEELHKYGNYMGDSHEVNDISEWENTDDDAEWKLEYVVPWGYNDLVVYSPTLFHQPYYKKEWFIDEDRFSLASMYNIKMEDIEKMPESLRSDAYEIWKKFELCKIVNYYF